MNMIKNIISRIMLVALIGLSFPLSAANSSQAKQVEERLIRAKAQLISIAVTPILSIGGNPSDMNQFKSLIVQDIKHIQDDIKKLKTLLDTIIDEQLKMVNWF